MVIEEVQFRVSQIAEAAKARDHEAAHSLRDALYLDVMRGIVAGDAYYLSLIEEALKAEEIDFQAWCA